MNPVHIELAKTLNKLATDYDNGVEDINFVDLRNLEEYIRNQDIDLEKVNEYLGF